MPVLHGRRAVRVLATHPSDYRCRTGPWEWIFIGGAAGCAVPDPLPSVHRGGATRVGTEGDMTDHISTLLSAERLFPPPPQMVEQAHGTEALYQEAQRDPQAFWAEQARALDWASPWDRVLDWTPPYARWFPGGRLNASANCLDRHLAGPRRNKAAILWEGEPGDRKVLTYWELAREVGRCANAL